jgi:hypothetical protein
MKLIAGSLSDPEKMQEWKRSAVAYVTALAAMLLCLANETREQATYDQRQNGDLNVHVHLQDVSILALLEENLFSGGYGVSDHTGHAIAQAVSRRLPTAAARVQTRVWLCRIL